MINSQTLTKINDIPIQRNFIENLPYNPNLKERTKALRKAGVFSEVIFGSMLIENNFII